MKYKRPDRFCEYMLMQGGMFIALVPKVLNNVFLFVDNFGDSSKY